MELKHHAEGILQHYSSEYYDPAKAHAYYMERRKLKSNTSGLSKEEAAAARESDANREHGRQYARKQIGDARKADREKLMTDQSARMEKLQTDAKAAQDRILEKLKGLTAGVQSQLKIPDNASPKLRAFLLRQQKAQTATAQKQARADLQKMGKDLQSALSSARTQYAAARDAIKAKYDQALDTEMQNINDQVK